MKEIPLTKGKVALVDDEDYEELSKYKWYAIKKENRWNWYAIRHVLKKINGYSTTESMHRHILKLKNKDGKIVDHIDRNSLNNIKTNLRIVSHLQNTLNSKLFKTNNSGYRGVHYSKLTKDWVAAIGGKCIGYYSVKEDAARAYDFEARQLYNEFAQLNFFDEIPTISNVYKKKLGRRVYDVIRFLNFIWGHDVRSERRQKYKGKREQILLKRILNLIYGYPLDYKYVVRKSKREQILLKRILNLIYGYPLDHKYVVKKNRVRKEIWKEKGIKIYNFITFMYQLDSIYYPHMVCWSNKIGSIYKEGRYFVV